MDGDASPFMYDWVTAHAQRSPDAPAIATPSYRLSYVDLADRMKTFSGHLASVGTQPGDRIVVALPNVAAAVVASLAVNALGATCVVVDRAWSAEVLTQIVARTGARQAIVWAADAARWSKVMAGQHLDRLWVAQPGSVGSGRPQALDGITTTMLLEDGLVDPTLPPPQPPQHGLPPRIPITQP